MRARRIPFLSAGGRRPASTSASLLQFDHPLLQLCHLAGQRLHRLPQPDHLPLYRDRGLLPIGIRNGEFGRLFHQHVGTKSKGSFQLTPRYQQTPKQNSSFLPSSQLPTTLNGYSSSSQNPTRSSPNSLALLAWPVPAPPHPITAIPVVIVSPFCSQKCFSDVQAPTRTCSLVRCAKCSPRLTSLTARGTCDGNATPISLASGIVDNTCRKFFEFLRRQAGETLLREMRIEREHVANAEVAHRCETHAVYQAQSAPPGG